MPSPPITIGELQDVPAFDSPIASPWAQETSRRIVHRFDTIATRDAKYPPPAAGEGAICYVAGNDSLYISNGSAWLLLAAQTAVDAVTTANRRMGAQVGGPAGSAGPGSSATLQFTTVTEDTDGLYVSGYPTVLWIPATAMWAVTLNVQLSATVNGTGVLDIYVNSAFSFSFAAKFNLGSATATVVRSFGSGNTVGARLFIDGASPVVNWASTSLSAYRVSP